jgi:hypothetical protein
MAAKKKVKRSPRTPEHPRFSILDEGEGYRVTLVDIGLPREAGKGENPTNFGLGDWDGQILHLKTTDRMNTLELKRTKNWTIEQVRDVMSAYVSVFQSIGQTVEEYDFTEVTIDEIIQWEPISALPQWDATVPSTDDGD